jgi:hypothetical protein
MKKAIGLMFVLGVVALAVSLTPSVVADPSPPPNDNVCICHQTQHLKFKQGEANDNQKFVIICTDPNSQQLQSHLKHGDVLATEEGLCPVDD